MSPANKTSRYITSSILLILSLPCIVRAQTDVPPPGPREPANTNSSTSSANSTGVSRAESSLFSFLNMSGRTRTDYSPLTSRERVRFYAKGMFGPVMLFTAASSAAITQARDVPAAWGQGAEGYGQRFGNYLAKQAIQRTLRLGGEELFHEDNRYFSSGEHRIGSRIAYALKSSVLARDSEGRQHFSVSQVGSIAGASFISRTWQPSTNNSVKDGFASFGIGLGSNAGMNVLREFLPDLTRHLSRH